MKISKELTDQIKQDFEIFQKTGENKFPVKDFEKLYVFFDHKPEKLLFPFGKMGKIMVYLGSD